MASAIEAKDTVLVRVLFTQISPRFYAFCGLEDEHVNVGCNR
jgi:hypothetical protein